VRPTSPRPPKLPVHNLTTSRLDSQRHMSRAASWAGTLIEVWIVSPPKRRALHNPAGDGVGEWYHSSASWSDEELQNLARAKLRALKLHPGGHNINQLLRGVVPCRSFDAMKGTCRSTK
ncbi:hypothetical protein LSAT2_031731, partial [Lamellibrachia satsuma]